MGTSKKVLKKKSDNKMKVVPKTVSIKEYFKPRSAKSEIKENQVEILPSNPSSSTHEGLDSLNALEKSTELDDVQIMKESDSMLLNPSKLTNSLYKECDNVLETVDISNSGQQQHDDLLLVGHEDAATHIEEPVPEYPLEITQAQDGARRSARNTNKSSVVYGENPDLVMLLDNLDHDLPLKNRKVQMEHGTTKRQRSSLFFMPKKEREQQIVIERSIQLQNSLKASSILSNSITHSGNSISVSVSNSFFAARQPKKGSSELDHSYTGPIYAPFPSKLQSHVGWIPAIEVPDQIFRGPPKIPTNLKTLDISKASKWYVRSSQDVRYNAIKSADVPKSVVINELLSEYGSCNIDNFVLFKKLQEQKKPLNQENKLWTDILFPDSREMIYGTENEALCLELSLWLKAWVESPGEFNDYKNAIARSKLEKRKRDHFIDDEMDDQDYSDGDESHEYLEYQPVILIVGPEGAGKTSVVNSATNDSGFHVLEMSASEKRNGKALNETLGGASTSQTIKLKKNSFFERNLDDLGVSRGTSELGRTCIVLEDVDILFEEDKGFWTALLSIIETSECPIIMTCTGINCTYPDSSLENPLKESNSQILHGLADLQKYTRVREVVPLDPGKLSMVAKLSAARMGFLLSETLLAECLLLLPSLRQVLNQMQFCCSGHFAGEEASWRKIWREDPPIDTQIFFRNQDIFYTAEQRSWSDLLRNNSEDPDCNILQIQEIFANLWIGVHEFPSRDLKVRLEIFSTMDNIMALSRRLIVCSEILPYLSLICRFDKTSSSYQESTRRSTRRTPRRHLYFLEQGDHQMLGMGMGQIK